MALIGGRGREELIMELAEARGELKALRSEVEFLKDQLRRTQEALIAKEAPEAYLDQKTAEAEAKPVSADEMARRKKVHAQIELDQKLLQEMESPLFKSAEDMQSMLIPVLMNPSEGQSLHGDGES